LAALRGESSAFYIKETAFISGGGFSCYKGGDAVFGISMPIKVRGGSFTALARVEDLAPGIVSSIASPPPLGWMTRKLSCVR